MYMQFQFLQYVFSSSKQSSSELMPLRGIRRPSVCQLFTF